jgi:hypothetical protein
MPNVTELSWQKKIVTKVQEAGGDGFKCAAKFISGYPDLALAHPQCVTTLAEVKMGVCVPDRLQRIICERLRRGGFRVIGICILMEGQAAYAIKFDPTNMSGIELMRVSFNRVVKLIWEDLLP